MKSLGKSFFRPAFISPEAHQAEEGFGREPWPILLRSENRKDPLGLSLCRLPAQRHEAVGSAQVSVPLGDLVLQNRVVPPSVPREVRDHTVVLVPVGLREALGVAEGAGVPRLSGRAAAVSLSQGQLEKSEASLTAT